MSLTDTFINSVCKRLKQTNQIDYDCQNNMTSYNFLNGETLISHFPAVIDSAIENGLIVKSSRAMDHSISLSCPQFTVTVAIVLTKPRQTDDTAIKRYQVRSALIDDNCEPLSAATRQAIMRVCGSKMVTVHSSEVVAAHSSIEI